MQSVVIYDLYAVCKHTLLSRSCVIGGDLVQVARWMCVVSGGVVYCTIALCSKTPWGWHPDAETCRSL